MVLTSHKSDHYCIVPKSELLTKVTFNTLRDLAYSLDWTMGSLNGAISFPRIQTARSSQTPNTFAMVMHPRHGGC